MRHVVLIAAAILGTSGAFPQTTSSSDEKSVLEAQQRWFEASRAGDAGTLATLLADDYIGVSITGEVVIKVKSLDRARAMTPEQRATYAKIEGSFEDVRVRLYGSVAVVTGRGNARLPSGPLSTRFVHVWNKDDRGWRLTTLQITRIESPNATTGTPGSSTQNETPRR